MENQKITEAEWHIGRENDVGISGEPGGVVFDVEELLANPPNQGEVPVDRRYSRDDLIAVANSYFDGIIARNSKNREYREKGTGYHYRRALSLYLR